MGSVQSASCTRQDATPREPTTSRNPLVAPSSPSHAIATSSSVETPMEGSVPRRTMERRRSLMKFSPFPSSRKRHSVIGLSDEGREDSVNASPSRRRWRGFGGLKSRPLGTIANADMGATNEEPSFEGPKQSLAEQKSTEKGKGREVVSTDEGSVEPQPPETPARELSQGSLGLSHPDIEGRDEHEHAFSPDTMLRELRELQDTVSTSDDSQSNVSHNLQAGDSKNQAERPLTPIPTSAIESTPATEGEGSGFGNRSNSALVEALGSWLSGRSREDNAEFPSSDAVSHSQNMGSSAPSQSLNAGASRLNDSAPSNASARSAGRTTGATGSMPSLAVPPGSRFGRNPTPALAQQDRRTLPPAGTGTLVIVQGVVHTTDVRHGHPLHAPPQTPSHTSLHAPSHAPSQAPWPSPSQTPSATTRPPRSSSSTPTLRTPSHLTSRTPSRPSTPQQQPSPRRSRFSSLTSSLRARSRPGTASSRRSVATAGWGRNPSTLSTPSGAGETASEPSNYLGVNNSALDSENAPASTSATDSSTRPRDASLEEPSYLDSRAEVIDAIDDLPLSDQSSSRTQGEETQPTDPQTEAHVDSVDNDGNDEEGEAELSASSIEVLGTLLSVATAATAASLVTGTTDPLFSSGLAGPHSNAPNRTAGSPPQGSSSTGLSPPPTQDVESSVPPDLGTDTNNADAAANTRMRAAWESLRDRFSRTRGRRSAVVGGAEVREDPREQMLREMARAFNTGLGLDPDDNRSAQERHEGGQGAATESGAVSDTSSFPNGTSRPEGDGHTARESEGPGGPEGSFERFLHNLQVDLRTALTEDYAARRARAQARDTRSAAETSSSSTPAQTSSASGQVPPSISSESTNSHGRSEETTSFHDQTGADVNLPSYSPLVSTAPNTPRPAALDLPSLPGDREISLDGTSVGNAPPQAHGITGQPGAGINWWRLYRFPLMQLAPHPSTLAAGGVPAAEPRPSPADPAASQDVGSDSHSQPSALPTNPEAAPTQTVVPVIVVGLQSVPANHGAQNPNHAHNHESQSPLETHSLNGGPNPPSDPPTRERRWPLRAASRALGRMSRRGDADSSADDGTVPPGEREDLAPRREGRQGGRTYLIFVIGGYYPPNHSIVTGADDMNSFEALWELAELLGQVKPPVASKEDIEKSGLEIIKASSLSEYEQAGKVASNTVERCLICLDDYEGEDDLRLLSCRHIFHKQCVDKWLEQGRNNCPACRTKGVRTGDESSAPTPTSDSRD